MLKFFSSLSFLYILAIAVLVLYGFMYYRGFIRSRRSPVYFPLAFFIISAACVSFLWINMNAPLRLKTFSNLDHHFLQHDGFLVTSNLELGLADTVNFENHPFSRFLFSKKGNVVNVHAEYSEEPFYIKGEKGYKILSANYPATGNSISFQCAGVPIHISAGDANGYQLQIGDSIYKQLLEVKKGISCWNIFRGNESFIRSVYYNDERVVGSLKNILVLRDNVSRKEAGELKYFVSGRLFALASHVKYAAQNLSAGNQQFNAALPHNSSIAWGIGFLENNRNQYTISYGGNDTFSLISRYPVAYPLTEENRDDWAPHTITRFLLSRSADIHHVPAVFREGFLFPNADDKAGFSPVLLTYRKDSKNEPVQMTIKPVEGISPAIAVKNNELLLPAVRGGFNWLFTIRDTFTWDFGEVVLTPSQWQWLIGGSLFLFFLLVFFTSLLKTRASQGWVWQLLSAVTMVLLTTRYFLYWRYKSFPPYEGMDLPSQQQLESLSNFGIIIFATVALAVIFGYGCINSLFRPLRNRITGFPSVPGVSKKEPAGDRFKKIFSGQLSFWQEKKSKSLFFLSWFLLLVAGGVVAWLHQFDPGVCRHLAIALTISWFVFLFLSYRFSPLSVSSQQSWWKIHTGKLADVLISNPVKIILSVSLLAVFLFIDIGFAIIFLNFLLFNEAFLCINYGIAGLSAGSTRNARCFGIMGMAYLVLFVLNLCYAPYVFKAILGLPQSFYIAGYSLFSAAMACLLMRLIPALNRRKRMAMGAVVSILLFVLCFTFFPKERILDKASMTRYRIDVLTTPVDQSIRAAYEEGKTYEPVIRAAQNQWFINTFIDHDNNPGARQPGFRLLPHAPQNKGAKYNAQATDLVTSRFLIAEHGHWAVLLYVLLLLIPVIMLASFYKLYPDFTNRTNTGYAAVTIGFSLLNYILISALLVILAATGRYIFFGQDLPFGSILSKQSILFPGLLILAVVLLFKNIPQEQYPNRKKPVPGLAVFSLLVLLLFFFKPAFNRNREFGVENLAKELDTYIQLRLQPVFDHIDTSRTTRRLSYVKKDELFTDSLRKMMASGMLDGGEKFFMAEINAYAHSGFIRHLDQRQMLYLDLYTGQPRLSVNENFFRVEPPPHLQQLWTGNVYGDTTVYNLSFWDAVEGSVVTKKLNASDLTGPVTIGEGMELIGGEKELVSQLSLYNRSGTAWQLQTGNERVMLQPNGVYKLNNPCRILLTDSLSQKERVLVIEPDAFMRNYYVNGSRFYLYPMKEQFIWARHFSESVATAYTRAGDIKKNAFISLDFELMESLASLVRGMMQADTAYKKGAEYGICIADGNGRIIALTDFIKGFSRPDPNDKAAFVRVILGENGMVSQSLLRKQIGNLNLLRLNPGPGSTFKPIVFSAIASQLDWDWDGFAAQGFDGKQQYYGGERVPEYDFEKNNGRISRVIDYLKYSDNYYHSNVLLLGSYPKQDPANILSGYFTDKKPGAALHWPWFTYTGKQYWLDGFQHWPGYKNGKANFGTDSSFTAIGLLDNYSIYTRPESFAARFDSLLFLSAYRQSGFVLPEYSLFDQQGENVDHRIPYDVFTTCFRGHVKGSSQVMISPAKMTEAFGRLISQNRNYQLTFNPWAEAPSPRAFAVDKDIPYNRYLSIIREQVFVGMREALYHGTAARLGALLKDGAPYYYYAKTGTTGDDAAKTKSKLLALVVSSKNVTSSDFNFRKNKFYTIYFTSQNGPASQNEAFQAAVIKYLRQSQVFKSYMGE